MVNEYIVNHQAEFWILIGFLFLVIEVVTGFVSGVFLFGGIGALITGALMMAGVLPETWLTGISSTGIASGLSVVFLWKSLKRLQGSKPHEKDNSSDLIGHEFALSNDLDVNNKCVTQFSGVSWKVEPDPSSNVKSIKAGERVVVTSVEVGLFKVKPKH
jgi:membrane protein implicated in regulation of membrane protease activity